jgi:ElaB/YqjD/DUF883 family membrane-anchored ribosome-binding protein
MATKRHTTAAVKHSSAALNDLSGEALDAVRQLMTEVRDETLDIVRAGRDQMEEYGQQAVEAIRDRPMRAVVAAFGLGCLCGVLLSRR